MSHLALSPLCQWPAAAAECLTRCTQQIPTATWLTSSLSDETNTHNTASKYNQRQNKTRSETCFLMRSLYVKLEWLWTVWRYSGFRHATYKLSCIMKWSLILLTFAALMCHMLLSASFYLSKQFNYHYHIYYTINNRYLLPQTCDDSNA